MGFDFTKKLKEILRKKKGLRKNCGFGYTKEQSELIVKNYEKKKGFGLNSGFDFIYKQNKL